MGNNALGIVALVLAAMLMIGVAAVAAHASAFGEAYVDGSPVRQAQAQVVQAAFDSVEAALK